jgi:predicted dehydrogenase
MKTLIVGFGSIGARHTRILSELGCSTAVVSSREIDVLPRFADLDSALSSFDPDYVIVSNPTHKHHETFSKLAELSFKGTVLVEKPLFHKVETFGSVPFKQTFVAYNFRFHPILKRLKGLLQREEVLSVQAYVGLYLPNWRPGTDFRTGYSASAEQGGGALRDLSHELDYLCWLFGTCTRVAALGGRFSPLEISSDDVYSLLMVTSRCPVISVQMNYLDRLGRRSILINTSNSTICADLINGTITIDKEVEHFDVHRDDSYRSMHQAILNGDPTTLCTLEEGVLTMRLIEAAEASVQKKEWIFS